MTLQGTILWEIAARRKTDIDAEKLAIPQAELKKLAARRGPGMDVISTLKHMPEDCYAVIAEIKRKSPSKGLLAPALDAAALASAYERGGAFAISCLVEPHFFGGGLSDLDAVRGAVSIPVLYKDFIVDPYQLWQARAHGADMALLIVALLGTRLDAYVRTAREAGVEPLVEIHDSLELEVALSAGARMIGVNNRDLRTFKTDLATSERLLPRLAPGAVGVAESGIRSRKDMKHLASAGAKAFLIGESLVTSENPEEALRALCKVHRWF
jgi:indole-3-glycerol phosphate synthase